jgi:hypothetical protein
LWLDFTWELHDNSDHWSFLERRVPVVLFHTGLHGDYHRPSDDAEKINRAGLREIGRYLLGVLIKVANEDRLPAFRSRVMRDTPGRQSALERPLAQMSLKNWPANQPPPKLGISWREDEAEPGSVFLTRVVGGTPAAAAGLAVHDRVYDINGQPFVDAAAFQSQLAALLASDPAQFTLLIERRGHLRTVSVEMRSERSSGQESGSGVVE